MKPENLFVNNNRGMILITSLLILTVLTTMITSTLDMTLFDIKLGRLYKSKVRGSYIADGALAQVIYWLNNPATFTDTTVGTYHANIAANHKGSSFFSKRRLKATSSYISGTNSLSQFADVNDDGISDTTADNPALQYDESIPDQKTFLDIIFSSLATDEKIINLKIFAPSAITTDVATVQVTIKNSSGNNLRIEAVLTPNNNFVINDGLQIGQDGTWNGNSALVHWSDIKVKGNMVLPNQLDKTPKKNNTLPPNNSSYPGSNGEDAWLDIRAEGTITGPAGGDGDSQPYSSDDNECQNGGNGGGEGDDDEHGGGHEEDGDDDDEHGGGHEDEDDNDDNGGGAAPCVESGHDNILQNQIVTIDNWDYTRAKSYAKKYGGYYTTDAAGNLYLNGGGAALNFKDVFNTTYGDNKGFIFIDTKDQQAPRADGANLATISLSGDFYTEGKFYIGANISSNGLGAGETVADAQSPPFDSGRAFDYTDTTDASKRIAIADLKANLNGAFYVAGQMDMQGGPKVFGGIVAVRGFNAGGNPEVWYDYDLKDGSGDGQNVIVRYWRKL